MNMMMTCLRCGREWEPRVEGRPKNCPGCKSPAWDRPKVPHGVAAKAHGIVSAAVRSGELLPQPCEVCGETAEAHHEDYEKPLEVNWLCKKHHRARHIEIGDALMESGVNLRNVPAMLARRLKSAAIMRDMTMQDFCIELLTRALLAEDLARLQREVPVKGVGDGSSADGAKAELGGVDGPGGDGGGGGGVAGVGVEAGRVAGVDDGRGEGGVDLRSDEGDGGPTAEDIERFHEATGTTLVVSPNAPEGAVVDMAALRAIAAGNLDPTDEMSGMVNRTEIGEMPLPHIEKLCVACETPLVEGRGKMSGKFSCADLACGMYGKEQKGKR
jgi:DNA-directed RNA polymerase subunit RPC12/RpoP